MALRPIALALLLTSACSSTPSTSDGGSDANAPNDGGSDVSTADASSDAPSDAGPTSYTLTFPAQSLTGEQTLCITQRLGNAGAIHVGSITSQLDPGDFQLIVYLSSATTEQTTPQACNSFGGFQDNTLQPIYLGRASSDTLTFPSGVGLALAANQMIEIELHQYATQQVSAGAHVTFGVMSDASFQNGAALFVQLASSFSVLSDNTPHTISGFNAIPAHMGAAKIFAITGYENATGTERKAWNAANPSDTSTQVYDSTTPFDQPLRAPFTTPLTFASGAGIAYQCTFVNTTGATVTSGTGRSNETCMFASYYYPSQGFELCFGNVCAP